MTATCFLSPPQNQTEDSMSGDWAVCAENNLTRGMLSIGVPLIGLTVIVTHGDASAGSCATNLKVVKPIAGAEVGLQESSRSLKSQGLGWERYTRSLLWWMRMGDTAGAIASPNCRRDPAGPAPSESRKHATGGCVATHTTERRAHGEAVPTDRHSVIAQIDVADAVLRP